MDRPAATTYPAWRAGLPREWPGGATSCAGGPVTGVGKVHHGRALDLVAVDALAGEYAAILAELGHEPPVPTRQGEVERLDALFPAGAFDLVTMTNALDPRARPGRSQRPPPFLRRVRAARRVRRRGHPE
jgi:hypothetical protein